MPTVESDAAEVLEPGRGKDGKFLPGNRFRPAVIQRKASPDIDELHRAVLAKAPPTRIAEVFDEILAEGTLKTKLAAIQWWHDILFGKPVTRQLTATDTVENFMTMMARIREAETAENEATEDVIDVEGEVIDGQTADS